MTSETTAAFRLSVRSLPAPVRTLARQAYRRWLSNPRHPSLQFKRVHAQEPIYSARIGIHWRALCVLEDDTAPWFWIGSHASYDAPIKRMRRG